MDSEIQYDHYYHNRIDNYNNNYNNYNIFIPIILFFVSAAAIIFSMFSGGARGNDEMSRITEAFIESTEYYQNAIYPQLYDDLNEKKIKNIDKICSICIDNYHKDNIIYELDCSHIFHKKCLSKWIELNNTCPLCRASI